MGERGLRHLAERAERGTRRHRIGGIGRDQQRRMVAAPHRALEAARHLDAEQHLARQQQGVELGLGVDLLGEMEIGGVFQRLEDRAREVAVLLQQHRRRQVVRGGVDGEAEQHQLHHRKHHDHGERHPVAAQLDEFLHQHRIAAPPEAEPARPGVAGMVRCMVHGVDRTHWKLSLGSYPWEVILGKSSLEVVLGAGHQFDEHVLQRRRAGLPIELRLLATGRDRRLQRRLV